MNKYKPQETQVLSKSGSMCNHLGSTAFVTDGNATVTQGFLYAPFGEITTEFNARFGNGIIPKYTFNAKELDEETGMYYYEARYYAPPVFTSRDPLFEKYFWMSPYAYCANNPVKYVDPTGMKIVIVGEDGVETTYEPGMTYDGNDKFTSDAIAGLNFLYNNPEGEKNRVADISNSEVITTIKKQNDISQSSKYWGASNILLFENTMVDDYGEGKQAPVIGLAHEIDHAYISVKAWENVWKMEDNGESLSNKERYMQCWEEAKMESDNSSKVDEWEKSAIRYENYIGTKTYHGEPISTYQRTGHFPPKNRYSTNSIFSIK